MEVVLIDTFVVPAEVKPAFLERATTIQHFIKALPGFVEGFLYQQVAGESRHNVVTVAVWESEAALENAKLAVQAENQRQGVNPQELRATFGVEFVRSVYERAAY